MASRGPGGSLIQASRPTQWSEWSKWEWTPKYGVYSRSRENNKGEVEWQYGRKSSAQGATSQQTLPTQPYSQASVDQQPRYAPNEVSALEQSNVASKLALRTATGGLTPEYPSAYPNSSINTSPVSRTTKSFQGSYSMAPTTSYQAPQASFDTCYSNSSQDRPMNESWTAKTEDDSNRLDTDFAGVMMSDSTGRMNQEYYQQKPSDNYTSRSTIPSKGYFETPKPSTSPFRRQDEATRVIGYPSSQISPKEDLNERGLRSLSLAEEMDDMSLPPSTSWRRSTAYPTTYTDQEDSYVRQESESAFTQKNQEQVASTKSLSTADKQRLSKSSSMTKTPSKTPSKRISKDAPKALKANDSGQRQPPTQLSHRNITAKNPKIASDTLDDRFDFQPSKEFRAFRVFMVMWSEPLGRNSKTDQTLDSNEDASQITAAKYDQKAYHSIRRFVIVVEKHGHSLCLPILTYNGQATLKPGVKQEDHAIIYTGENPPAKLQGEENIYKSSVRMIGDTPRDKLDAKSRINYAKIYTVEHNVKVRFIGSIHPDSEVVLFADYRRSVDPPPRERIAGGTSRTERVGTKSSGREKGDRRKSGK